MTARRRIFAVGPTRGGVRDAFLALMAAVSRRGDDVVMGLVGSGSPAALDAARLAWRRRRVLRSAEGVHCEFGSNDLAAFWFALIAVHCRRDVVVVVHDVPKVALAPASGLIPVGTRLGSVIAYRVLAPLLDRRLIDRLLRRAKSVVVLSASAADAVSARGGQAVVVSHGGHVPTPDAPPPSKGEHVLFAGHIGPSKGLDPLLAAWNREPVRSHQLLIAGPVGPNSRGYVDALRRRSAQRSDVKWIGFVEDEASFQDLFARAAVVVLPYLRSSPASGILVRAMVEGRCVIATPVPAVREILREDPQAIVVVPIGDVDALARALDSTLSSGALRDERGCQASHAARRFSWDATAEAVASLYPAPAELPRDR